MRIGIDLRLPTYRLGGISNYALSLLRSLAPLIDEEDRVFVGQSRKESRSLAPDDDRFRPITLWTPPHHRLERWALATELMRHRLDVWHSPDFIPPSAGARRRVVTIHDLNFIHFPQFLTAASRRYYNDQIAWAVRQADAISVDSEHTRQDLISLLGVPEAKVRTIYLAADPLYREPVPRADVDATLARLNLPRGFLLFVGTLEPRKNIPTLLEAYARAGQLDRIDAPLVLVGRVGWLADEIFTGIEMLGLGGQVRHLDDVDNATLLHLYHAASLLAMPSHYEGFGLPPLEAMHCGCPVLVSDRGSLPEIVGDAGTVLPADDVDAWRDALVRNMHDSAYRNQSAAAGKRRAAEFTWSRCAKATLALYRDVAEK